MMRRGILILLCCAVFGILGGNAAAQGSASDLTDILAYPLPTTGTNYFVPAELATSNPISGYVKTLGGTGIQGVGVTAYDTASALFFSNSTDLSGHYSLAGIPDGNYKIYFNGSDAGYSSSWFNNTQDINAAEVISVAGGVPTDMPDVILSPVQTYHYLMIIQAGTGHGTTAGAGMYATGSIVPLAATPAADSVFAGWSGSPGCSAALVTMSTDKICAATFNLRQYNLTINTSGPGTISAVNPTYAHGSTVTITAYPDANSAFTGWSGSSGCAGTSPTLQLYMSEDKSCTATFVPVYTLTVNTVGSGTTSGAGSYNAGTTAGVTATPALNWVFSSWSGTCSGSNPFAQVPMTGNLACTATFVLKKFTLLVNIAGAGYGSTTGSGIYDYNTSVAPTATAATDSKFTGWSGACSGAALTSTSVTMDADKSCTASFDRVNPSPNYAMIVSTTGSGFGTVSGEAIYKSGDTAALTATASAGSAFTTWGGNCTGETPLLNVTMNGDKICTANFELIFEITWSVQSGSGSMNCSPPSPALYDHSATCDLSPLGGWYVHDLLDNNISVTQLVSNNQYSLNNIREAHTLLATYQEYPVRRAPENNPTNFSYATGLAAAVSAANAGDTILAHNILFAGSVTVVQNITLRGGFVPGSTFSALLGTTTVHGAFIVESNGSVEIENITVF